MKDQAIQFLGNLPENEGEQFNKALELYRKSKGHDAGKLRFNNTLGYSKERLESLLYDLKKQHSISDVEVAQATKVVKKKKAPKKDKILFDVDAKAVKKMDVVDPLVVGDEKIAEIKKEVEKSLELPGDIVSEDGKVIFPKMDKSKDGDQSTVETSEEENKAHADAAMAEREKFLKEELANFDTASEKYNSIKSFASVLSDYIKEDPKNQKADTLKAFIEDAKKNFAPS